MKKAWLFSFNLFYFWSCQPDQAPVSVAPVIPPVTTPETPALTTEKGIPDGTAVSTIIGASGGAVTSSDGCLTLTVPAGALSTNTTIGIQPITNKMLNGIGLAYRLTPEGQQFSKPNPADCSVQSRRPGPLEAKTNSNSCATATPL